MVHFSVSLKCLGDNAGHEEMTINTVTVISYNSYSIYNIKHDDGALIEI